MKWTENSVFSLRGAVGLGDILQYTRLPEYFYRDFKMPFRLIDNDRFAFFESIKNVEFVSDQSKLRNQIVRVLWKDSSTYRDPGSPVYKAVWQYTDVSDRNLKPILDNKTNHKKYNEQMAQIRARNKPVVALVLRGTSAQFKFQSGPVLGLAHEIPSQIVSEIINELSKEYRFILVGLNDYDSEVKAEDFRMPPSRSIYETYDILNLCSYYIGVNTGLMHLAACHPHLKLCMYTQTPIKFPIWENDFKNFPAFEWLYNDTIYWGHRSMKDNVLSPQELIQFLRK